MEPEKITQALSAATGVVYFEDPSELDKLLKALRDMYQPVGPAEEFAVEQMAAAQWDIRRYRRVLTGLLDYQTSITAGRLQKERLQDRARTDPEIHQGNTTLMGAAFHFDCQENRAQISLHRMLMDLDRAYHRSLKSLEAAQARRARVAAIVESQSVAEPIAAAAPKQARHTVAAVQRAPQPSESPVTPAESSVSSQRGAADKSAFSPPGISHAH